MQACLRYSCVVATPMGGNNNTPREGLTPEATEGLLERLTGILTGMPETFRAASTILIRLHHLDREGWTKTDAAAELLGATRGRLAAVSVTVPA